MVRVICYDLRNNAVSTSEQSVPLTVNKKWRFESVSPCKQVKSMGHKNTLGGDLLVGFVHKKTIREVYLF